MRGIQVAIDLGTTELKTVVARRDGRLRILGVSRQPVAGMRRGVVVDTDEVASALRRSVLEASRAAGVTVRSATVGIGGAHLSSFSTRGTVAVSRADGEVTEADITRSLRAAEGLIPRNPNREVIHVIPRHFRVDGGEPLRDPLGVVGMKLEVDALVVEGARQPLANTVKCFELAGIDIDDWAVTVLAAAEIALSSQQRELGAMLLDLGGGTTAFAVYEEGRLCELGVFPIGGSRITQDIAIGLRTDVAVAEAVKRRHARIGPRSSLRGEAIRLAEFKPGEEGQTSERELAEIVEARLSDIFELAERALKKIGRAGLLAGGVTLIGGSSAIPGIREFAKRELALPAEVLSELDDDDVEGAIPAELVTALALIRWRQRPVRTAAGGGLLPWPTFARRARAFLRSFLP